MQEKFRYELGEFLRIKREKRGYTLEDVAVCIHSSKSSVDRYERGYSMPADYIPIFCGCYGCEMNEFFDKQRDIDLAETFKDMVKITRKRYQREKERENKKSFTTNQRVRTGYLYMVDGVEIKEYIFDDKISRKKEKSLREKHQQGEMYYPVAPLSDEEFCDYLYDGTNKEVINAMKSVREILSYIGDASGKETIKKNLSDLVINGLIIDRIIKDTNNEWYQRLYMYYRLLLFNEIYVDQWLDY